VAKPPSDNGAGSLIEDGRTGAPNDIPGADRTPARPDDPSGADLLARAGDDPRQWTGDERLARQVEGQEVDEPDPAVWAPHPGA
jgi:hypothetical protein